MAPARAAVASALAAADDAPPPQIARWLMRLCATGEGLAQLAGPADAQLRAIAARLLAAEGAAAAAARMPALRAAQVWEPGSAASRTAFASGALRDMLAATWRLPDSESDPGLFAYAQCAEALQALASGPGPLPSWLPVAAGLGPEAASVAAEGWSLEEDAELVRCAAAAAERRGEDLEVAEAASLFPELGWQAGLSGADVHRSSAACAARFACLRALSAALAAPAADGALPLACLITPRGALGGEAEADGCTPPPLLHLRACSAALLPSLRGALLARALAASAAPPGREPGVQVDRQAASSARARRASGDARHSIFSQLRRALAHNKSFALRAHDAQRAPPLLWRTTLVGEGAVDGGGPFREVLNQAIDELMEAEPAAAGEPPGCALSLLQPTPNARLGGAAAECADCRMPSTAASLSGEEAEGCLFLGRLIGAAVRTGNLLPLRLPPLTWKQLLGCKLGLADLAEVDKAVADRLRCVARADAADWAALDVRWAVAGAERAGERPILPVTGGGPAEPVPWERRVEYAEAALAARLAEGGAALKELRRGLETTLPAAALALLTWRELEARACGDKEWSVPHLRACSAIEAHSPAEAATCALLWPAMETLSAAQRASVLAFATGRSRLPQRPRRVLTVDAGAPAGLPTAGTCGSVLHLPRGVADAPSMASVLLVSCANAGLISDHGFDAAMLWSPLPEPAAGGGRAEGAAEEGEPMPLRSLFVEEEEAEEEEEDRGMEDRDPLLDPNWPNAMDWTRGRMWPRVQRPGPGRPVTVAGSRLPIPPFLHDASDFAHDLASESEDDFLF